MVDVAPGQMAGAREVIELVAEVPVAAGPQELQDELGGGDRRNEMQQGGARRRHGDHARRSAQRTAETHWRWSTMRQRSCTTSIPAAASRSAIGALRMPRWSHTARG